MDSSGLLRALWNLRCWQVAELMLRGVEQGRYCLLFPDTITTFITASLGGLTPLSMPWWLAAPAAFITVSSPC